MIPRWALGYQQSRFSYSPDSRVIEIADTFRHKRIPCDVIWMDIDYMDGYRISHLTHKVFLILRLLIAIYIYAASILHG